MRKAILLSGGMDSIAIAYWLREEISLAITINYGQKSSKKEIEISRKICEELNLQHEIIEVDCSALGGGEMCDNRNGLIYSIPEWWPYRNQLLITLACMKLITYQFEQLIVGCVKTDNRFIDGTKDFFETISKVVSMQEGGISILTPAIHLTTVELIKNSKIPERLLFWAHSCHASNEPCGACNGCLKYLEVVNELNYD